MKPWTSCWREVKEILITASTRRGALDRVSALRGGPVTWDALARAWRRYKREDECSAATALGISLTAPIEPPSMFAPIVTRVASGPPGAVCVPVFSKLAGKSEESTPQKHLVIPDTQCEPGAPDDHFTWIGKYIVAKDPDTVILMGDHWDMPSLSVYESATAKAARGSCKKADIDSGNRALELLEDELVKGGWEGRKVLLEGNHDGFSAGGRPARYLADHPDDRGLLTPELFADSWLNWERIPFLQPIEIDGVLYCHLFPLNRHGRVTNHAKKMGAANADAQIGAVGQSCTAGHKQGLSVAIANPPFGQARRGLIAGSCYQHDHAYSAPAKYWRGIILKHSVGAENPNHYDLCEVPLSFLKEKHS